MSEIIRTDAVVLRSIDYRETSKIVTLYTRHAGRMGVLVKGARQKKNPFGSTLEPLSYISAVIYTKEGRDLQLLTAADFRKMFRSLPAALDSLAPALAILEIVNRVTHDGEENHPLFDLVVGTLSALDESLAPPPFLLAYFEFRLAAVLGFRPQMDACASCGKAPSAGRPEDLWAFDHSRGAILCSDCADGQAAADTISGATVALLGLFLAQPPEVAVRPGNLSEVSAAAVKNAAWRYLRYHAHGLRDLAAEKIFIAFGETV
ncbi:MAG TPA: DNA repair protein RecO [Bacteroidota bacterium]|nr:DNA repair protein RecO [Bacteroidota bacterium]